MTNPTTKSHPGIAPSRSTAVRQRPRPRPSSAPADNAQTEISDRSTAVRQRQRPPPASPPVDSPHVETSERSKPATFAAKPEYEVGYGKPPKHAQFRPGQSGNPKGRPSGSKSPFTLLREELQRKVTLRENGRVTTVTKLEAIMKRVVADTLSGKASQTKLLFALLQLFEAQDATAPEDRNLSVADEELLRNLMEGFSDE